MKIALCATLLTVALTAQASAAIVEFRGAVCLTKKNASCTVDGWNIGDCFIMRFSPPNLGTNGAATQFTLLGQAFADNYELKTGTLVGATLQSVTGTHVGRTGYSFAATMKISKLTPAKPTATTPQLTLAGSITRFGDTPGCNVDFTASGINRP